MLYIDSVSEFVISNGSISYSPNFCLKYDIPQVNISPEYVKSKDFILGLNFILGLQGAITITKNYITLSKHIYSIPTLRYNQTSELAQKRGGLGNLEFLRQNHPKTNLQIENDTIKLLTNMLTYELEKGIDVTKSFDY